MVTAWDYNNAVVQDARLQQRGEGQGVRQDAVRFNPDAAHLHFRMALVLFADFPALAHELTTSRSRA